MHQTLEVIVHFKLNPTSGIASIPKPQAAMARKLPWKRASESSPSGGTRNAAAQSSRSPASRPAAQDENRDILQTPVARRHVQRVLDSGMNTKMNLIPPHKKKKTQRLVVLVQRLKINIVDPIRSPSTSPPPERPHEEYIRTTSILSSSLALPPT